MRKSVSIGIVLLLVTLLCIVGVNATPVLNPDNGHYYDIKTGQHGITWLQANSAAQSLTYKGLQGHLVTITSQEEQVFINANFGEYFNDNHIVAFIYDEALTRSYLACFPAFPLWKAVSGTIKTFPEEEP